MPVYQYAGVPVVVLSSLGTLELDMVSEVTVTENNLVTQHPTETGSSLADNIVVLPNKIRLAGRFVDYPLPELGLGSVTAFAPEANLVVAAVAGAAALAEGVTRGRSQTMWGALEQLRKRKELVEVNVQQGTYFNMAIVSINAPRSPGDGGSQQFQIEMREVIIAVTTTAEDDENLDDEFAHSGAPVIDQGVKSTSAFP